MVLALSSRKKQLSDDVSSDKLSEEVTVLMMADLQERQTKENNALMQALIQLVS